MSSRIGKNYEEIYGAEAAVEIRTKISASLRKLVVTSRVPKGGRPNTKGISYTCNNCSRPFVPTVCQPQATNHYCSDECRNLKGVYKKGKCEKCGTKVTRSVGKRLFCSRLCYNSWRKENGHILHPPSQQGTIASKETRQKRSEKAFAAYRTGQRVAPMLGKQHSKEWYVKMAPSFKKMSIERRGKGNPSWKDEKVNDRYPETWTLPLRREIRARDCDTCQVCSTEPEKEYNLCVHHIDYSKENNAPQNLICLCRLCHSRVHGRPKRRMLWQHYFQFVMVYRTEEQPINHQ